MDFVASRVGEHKNGWRNRVGRFLAAYKVTVFDPWSKPQIRGLYESGREGINTQRIRKRWTFRLFRFAEITEVGGGLLHT